MVGARKRRRAELEAKVALEAMGGELTMAQLAAKHGVHRTMIDAWKKQAVEVLATVFSGKAEAVRPGDLQKLFVKIGQLVVGLDFL